MDGWPGTQLFLNFSISLEVSFWGHCFSSEKGLYEGKPGCWYSDSQLGRGKQALDVLSAFCFQSGVASLFFLLIYLALVLTCVGQREEESPGYAQEMLRA